MSPSPLQQIATYIQRQQVASAVAYSSTPEGQKHEEASDGPGPSQVALNEEESEGEGEQMQVGTEELYQQVCVCVSARCIQCLLCQVAELILHADNLCHESVSHCPHPGGDGSS